MFKFLASGLILFSFQLFSQEYPVKIFTTNDGLSQMQVVKVFKDSRGFIWSGTKYGVSKYNGEKFTRYAPKLDTLGFEVQDFAEDLKGNIYMNGVSTLCRFDGAKFWPIKKPKGLVDAVSVDHHNQVFVVENSQLYKIDKNDSMVVQNWPSLKGKRFGQLKYNEERKEFIAVLDSIGLVSITSNKIKILISEKNPNNSFQINYKKQTGYIINLSNPKESSYSILQNNNSLIPIIKINGSKIEVANTTNFDFPFLFQSQLYILEANSTHYQIVENQIFNPSIQPVFTKNGFFIPSEQGLIRVYTNGFKYFKKEIVPNCWAVSEDRFGKKWFWNYEHPVITWDGTILKKLTGYLDEINKIGRIKYNDKNWRLADNWYFGHTLDKYGNLWQVHAAGLMRYDNKKFNFLFPKERNAGTIFSVLEDPTKNLILAGGDRLLKIYENKAPYKVTEIGPNEGMNVGRYILAMALEKSGVYWLGGGNMLSRYDSNNKTWKEYSQKNGKIKSRIFTDMIFDDRKTLWIGSPFNGLFYHNAKLDSIIKIQNVALNSPISFIGQYNSKYLLLGGSRDLHLFDLDCWYKTGKVLLKSYNHNNGFLGLEPGQRGFFKDSKGVIYVTSSSILSVIEPKKLNLEVDSLNTFFTQFNRNPIPFNTSKQEYKSNGDVRIEFESVGENKSVESQYSYKLNDEKVWSPWQNEPVAHFTRLASGKYTICVRSRTGNGDDSFSKIAKLNFTVSVMPWESPNFPIYALIALLISGVLGYIYLKSQKLERIKQDQKLQKQELDFKNQSLKVQALQVQTAQAQMNPHFTFNVLNTLQDLIYDNDTKLANENLLKLSKLMRSYLDASISSEIDPNAPEKSMITLDKEVELLQMYIDFEKLKYNDLFEAKITISPEIGTDFYRLPPLLIQPFLENAILHGVIPNTKTKGKIDIDFDLDDDENLVCTITDNGIGRTEAALRKQNQVAAHQSRGTELVEKRVKILNEMGYKISIETIDNEPTGTIVTIKIIAP